MKFLLVLIITSVLLFYGCISIDRQEIAETDAEKKTKAPEVKEELFAEEKANEIVQAIEYALSLETIIWDKRDQITEREDVVNIFKNGFCESKAEEITDYIWIEAVDRSGNKVYMLNPGEPLFTLPDSIEVLSEDKIKALALLRYGENLSGPVTWAGHTIVASLRREYGVWKICETRVEESEE
jgi:hypothetical protein